jgi:3-oxoacyl-[acyl-carrier protein] reductase
VAAKSGLIGLTRALARRWAPEVRVNAVASGLTETPMTAGMPPEVLQELVDRIPAGRIGQPEDVAAAVSKLASAEAAYVTGQVHYVCGGRSLA